MERGGRGECDSWGSFFGGDLDLGAVGGVVTGEVAILRERVRDNAVREGGTERGY